MAERVAAFLAQMGYKNLAVMSGGFPAWLKAGYPVETSSEKGKSLNFWEREEEKENFNKVALGASAIDSDRELN